MVSNMKVSILKGKFLMNIESALKRLDEHLEQQLKEGRDLIKEVMSKGSKMTIEDLTMLADVLGVDLELGFVPRKDCVDE